MAQPRPLAPLPFVAVLGILLLLIGVIVLRPAGGEDQAADAVQASPRAQPGQPARVQGAAAEARQAHAPGGQRLAGPDRFATAAAVAVETFPDGASTALLARGDDFADALAAAALAGAEGAPILLTPTNGLAPAALEAMEDLGVDSVVVLGGETAVGPQVAQALSAAGLAVERLAGADRFQTASLIAEAVASAGGVGQLDGVPTAFLASGEDFPDALAAGGAAFAASIPILLSSPDSVPAVTVSTIQDLGIAQIVLLGGSAALSPAVEQQLDAMGVLLERIGGATRLETATDVADFSVERLGFPATQVVLTRGDAFPDALAAAPLSGAGEQPILLTAGPHQLGAPAGMWMRARCGSILDVIAVGAAAVLSDAVLADAVQQLTCGGVGAGTQLLTDEQRQFLTSTQGWVPQGNTTIDHEAAVGREDSTSMGIDVDQSGPFPDESRTARVGTSPGTDAIPAIPGETYDGTWWIRPAGDATSQARCELRWYGVQGDIISTHGGPAVDEQPAEWVQANCSAVAPPAAAYVGLRVLISDAAYGERHLLDDASLVLVGAGGPTPPPTPAPTSPPTSPPTVPPTGVPMEPIGAYPDGPGDTGIAAAGLTTDDLTPSASITARSGDVIDGMHVTGAILLEQGAQDVVIRNTQIDGTGTYGIWSNSGVGNLLVEDVTIVGISGSQRSAGILALGQGRVHGVDVSGYPDGIKVFSDFIIEESWVHDQVLIGDSHNDGIQSVGGSGVVIRNNRVEGPYQTQTSALILQADSSPLSDYTVTGNFLSGGTYTLYVRAKAGMPDPSRITITNNVWDGLTSEPASVQPQNSWLFGTCSLDRGDGWTIAGNVFRDGSPDPC